MNFDTDKLKSAGITVGTGKGQLEILHVKNRFAEADISPYGAHILSFIPAGQQDLLWMSSCSEFKEGKPIRGGIPVCWPWFGPVKTPAHGTARISTWQIKNAFSEIDGSTVLTMVCGYAEGEQKLSAEIRIHVGSALTVELITTNESDTPFPLMEALHTYFQTGDISGVRVSGLDGVRYFDKLTGEKPVQSGDILITEETDRIYLDFPGKIIFHDAGMKRSVCVERYGSESAVVWNPWIAKAHNMADFPDDGFRNMLCVEAANADTDTVTLAPGGKHRLSTRISLVTDAD